MCFFFKNISITAGNGNSVTDVPGVPRDTIKGDLCHLLHTFDIKYADRIITSKNMKAK